VLVDCGTYIACSSAGLDIAGEAIPCIAGRGEHGALDAIHHKADTVDINARRIEAAIHDQTDTAPEAAITARAVEPARITTRSAISPAWHRADDARCLASVLLFLPTALTCLYRARWVD
jgi:hypothetical protein